MNRTKTNIINRDSHFRSFLKGISWRIFATLLTATIDFLIKGRLKIALEIGGIEAVAKLLFYYLHERLWQIIPKTTINIEGDINSPETKILT